MGQSDVEFPDAGKRITVQHAHSLISPEFFAPYPDIRNPELLDPGARRAMEVSWKRGNYEEAEVKIFHLKKVYFVNECLILDHNLQMIENASDRYDENELKSAINSIKILREKKILPHFPAGVVSKRRAAGNYGHYLMEMLPMALIGRQYAHDYNPRYIVHRVAPEMQDVVFRSLRLAGIPLNRLLVKDYEEPIFLENLFIVRGLSQHGTFMSPLSPKAINEMSVSVLPSPYKRIFVERIPGWNRGRALINQAEVSARLAAVGFTSIEPSAMPLEEQIAAFRGADIVVGVSGAAMTNIAFCKPGTTVIMLVPARFPDTFFWFIAVHRGLRFTELRAVQDAMEGVDNWKADFRLSESDIQYLEDLGGTASPDVSNQPSASDASPLLEIVAYSDRRGAMMGRDGEWVGKPGGRTMVEGFAIKTCDPLQLKDVSYCGILGKNWSTARFSPTDPCGSFGWKLPLAGFEIQLHGAAESAYECRYSATFLDGSRRDDVPSGEICVADSFSPLESFRVIIRPRSSGKKV